MTDRYYVQRVGSLQLIRELQAPGDIPSVKDPIIRRFTTPDDAHACADEINGLQYQLDHQRGQQWASHAVTPEIKERPGHER